MRLTGFFILYWDELKFELPWLDDVVRSKRPVRLPAVLIRPVVRSILALPSPPYDVTVSLLYGSGLRISEALRLRIKDVDLDRRWLTVRDGKGAKDRTSVLTCIGSSKCVTLENHSYWGYHYD